VRAPSSLQLYLRTGISAGVAALLVGCGGVSTDYSSLNLAQVSGTVTLDGKALAGAAVYFEPSDPLISRSYATTDSGGRYVLEFDSVKKGATLGEKTVRILGIGIRGEEAAVEPDGGAAPAPQADAVPACYNKESKLKATVNSGSQTMNFDLKSDCSVTGPTS
jgi:hypothetical protein